ncbi:MAG: Ig-like domain-containing protein [Ignavibacteria bacterium]|nr:Ig-like domain-containing protein [Ignavibacteria bacterium]
MKKLILLILLTRSLLGQDLFGTKIYINPGHGGLDPANDRFVSQTGFWESVSNLDKGLALRNILLQLNTTVYMSRVANADADDLPLSQIVADCNAKNVDFFHSIHSNGFNGQSNYTLILYQGTDTAPTYSGSLTMGGYLSDEIYKANRTTAKYNRGDMSFYNSPTPYLGVFRNLNVPGTLSEGSFHDYIPESWRLMNSSYKKHEAWAIARGFLKYFAQPGFSTGIIAGLARDMYKTVSYYAISSKGDTKVPVNNLKVTLQPGDRVFQGDNLNNGFYMFDSVAPGTYKLYFESPDYVKDSSTVVVAANQTVFSDKLMLYDSTIAPTILSHAPVTNFGDSVSTITKVQINFDKPMSTTATANAFSISPLVEGTLSWANQNMTLTFTPAVTYEKLTTYTITVSTGAKSVSNVSIAEPYSFTFTTKSRNRLNLLSSYPVNNQEGISTTFFGRARFDAAILSQSVSGNVLLYSPQNVLVPLSIVTSLDNGIGIISFQPQSSLEINSTYRLVIGESLKDSEGIPTAVKDTIVFKTVSEKYLSGTIVDSFEVVGQWKNPGLNSGSTGIDSAKSMFNVTVSYKYSGVKSGRLAYVFTQPNGGVCQYFNAAKPSIGSDVSSEFGLWVKGDLSYNVLEYWFNDESNAISEVTVDTITWSGWLLKRIPKSTIGGSGQKYFNSIVVKQTPNGTKNSILYVDDAQYNILLPAEGQKEKLTPESLTLYQNYPNPFNPETRISWQLTVGSYVTIKVFDILGNEVATLVNEFQQAGRHNYELGISPPAADYELTSGVYFYQLRAGDFVQTKKLVVLK